jgi:hypothetical protein
MKQRKKRGTDNNSSLLQFKETKEIVLSNYVKGTEQNLRTESKEKVYTTLNSF